jgi:urocanate hydratase
VLHRPDQDVPTCLSRLRDARAQRSVAAIGFHGNVVSLWEALAEHAQLTGEMLVDLGSDQTSLHNPYNGGMLPYQGSLFSITLSQLTIDF